MAENDWDVYLPVSLKVNRSFKTRRRQGKPNVHRNRLTRHKQERHWRKRRKVRQGKL